MAIKLPAPFLPKLKLATAPVQEDELIQAIKSDPLGGGDDGKWILEEDLDSARIEAFLDDALREMGPEAPENQS